LHAVVLRHPKELTSEAKGAHYREHWPAVPCR
jgi:hypothetical protein